MRAYYRGYQRVGVARVHVIRETPVAGRSYGRSRADLAQAWCGIHAAAVTNSPIVPVEVTPGMTLAAGLAWCPTCVGRAAAHVGLIGQVVDLIASAVPDAVEVGRGVGRG
jgi:hypothetical protein